ncbi:MAG: alkaline phosphatase D family protein [Bacteroidota bacterium]
MKNTFLLFPLCFLFALSCNTAKKPEAAAHTVATQNPTQNIQTIAFGSCNKANKPQDIWAAILQNQPDLWVWLGDNIYGDTEDMELMKAKYDRQKGHAEYQALLKACPVVGIWDDHDYGANDAGKEYGPKKESKALMLDFLDVPKEAPVRKREGAYQAYTFGSGAQKVKLLLLDARYFRDNLEPTKSGKPRYYPNKKGDILGDAQWRWLESELRANEAAVHIICSGIQILPEEHMFEKWANFPIARGGLLKMLALLKPNRPVLLSGDRHIGEISVMNTNNGLLTEITSSGLTHSYEAASGEANRYRKGDLVSQRNFGLLRIDWTKTPIQLTAELRGLDNVLYEKFEF